MKTLILDIETAPNLADVWSLWNVNVSLSQLRASSYTLCWAAKWLGEKKMFFGAEWDDKGRMIDRVHSLFNEADAIVTYNGDRFDLPTLNKDFLLERLGPPAPYKSIDILKTVKKHFRFPSNKLAYVSDVLLGESKLQHTGHGMWTAVQEGDKKAQALMAKYCKKDVNILEDVYMEVLPWISGHPDANLYSDDSCWDWCGRCDSGLTKQGFAYTLQGKFQRYKCSGCGTWSRGTKRLEGVNVVGI